MFRPDQLIRLAAAHSWLICRILFALYLCVLTVMDIRRKRLNLAFLLSGFLLVAAGIFAARQIHPLLLLTGGGVGLVFFVTSKVTGEAFGYGDSLLILIMGSFLGFWDILSLLTAAFLLAGRVFRGDAGREEVQPEDGRSPLFPFWRSHIREG